MTAPFVKTYKRGALVRIEATFTADDDDNTPVDPTTVTARFIDPSGPTQHDLVYGEDVAVVRSDVGVFYVDVDAATVGTWPYRWEGTGAGQAADEHAFKVAASQFT